MVNQGGAPSVIQGTVRRAGAPVEAAYIDLLDTAEQFIAERRTSQDGSFAFRMPPGEWVLVCRAAGHDPVRRSVTTEPGENAVDFEL